MYEPLPIRSERDPGTTRLYGATKMVGINAGHGLRRFIGHGAGVTTTEYAILLAFLVVGIAGTLLAFGVTDGGFGASNETLSGTLPNVYYEQGR